MSATEAHKTRVLIHETRRRLSTSIKNPGFAISDTSKLGHLGWNSLTLVAQIRPSCYDKAAPHQGITTIPSPRPLYRVSNKQNLIDDLLDTPLITLLPH